MALGAFKQGDAFLASVDGGMLKVPMHRDLAQVTRWRVGLLDSLIDGWLRNRKIFVQINLDRLVSVYYDANDRDAWFDLTDQGGRALRLLFPVFELVEKETVVLTALRDQVISCGLKVDVDTRRALGISDYLP